jgi:cysteinyl-tRNA synthetase
MSETSPQIVLHNTLTRAREAFRPIDPSNVRMYVCGPTVYDLAHIGNARPVIVFDVLYRLLRQAYGVAAVKYVRNITDVDDKINDRAARDYPGLPLNQAIAEVTRKTAEQFHADVAALGCLPPDVEPRATDHIAPMRDIIERLVAAGFAYVAEEHVLFSPSAMDAAGGDLPRYGALANRSLDEMIAGARVDVAPYKREATDFVLWKPSRPGEPAWPSPAGIAVPGRPGWHIECSAMSWQHLGEVFDIHGGGIDLVFPHHENEIAQSTCAFGHGRMANVWMHNGFLQVEGQKMSKSLGNFVTIRELLDSDRFGGRSWPGEALRLNMLRTHYRQPIDWTAEGLEESLRQVERWRGTLRRKGHARQPVPAEFLEALADDLNTPRALALLSAYGTRANSLLFGGGDPFPGTPEEREREGLAAAGMLLAAADLIGLDLLAEDPALSDDVAADIHAKVDARLAARKARDFAESDRLRDELVALGVVVMDGKDPATGEPSTTWEVKR